MIFLTITGSLTTAIVYDRREKRRAQQKWCDLVAHIANEPLDVHQMRRKLTVYLAAPPGDGLRVARDHFKEYVKPILTAAALDYNVIEGRREGEVRAGTAEQIRKIRRKAGEQTTVVEEPSVETVVLAAREQMGVTDEPGPKGDLVIGRHTWKEYVRGLHEGWLGPLDPPPPAPVEEPVAVPEGAEETMKDIAGGDQPSPPPSDNQETPETKPDEANNGQVAKLEDLKIDDTKTEESKAEQEEKEKPSKPTGPKPAHITTADYPTAQLPSTLPQSLDSSIPIEFPHILGFTNTPIRMYRYVTQRYLAESIGRDVASIVLASAARPYCEETPTFDSELGAASSSPDDSVAELPHGNHEQQTVLAKEEKEWHSSVHKPTDDDRERVWLNDVVLDSRISSRMKHSLISAEDEARSQRIAEEKEYILGQERPAPIPFWRSMWINYGYGEDDETIRRKPILGNLDGEEGA
jgi:import inner membrane translocase subunit TIM54